LSEARAGTEQASELHSNLHLPPTNER
jgi:hypothetical protein